MTSSPPSWWTKIKDFSLASFVRPPEVVHFSIVIGVPRGWLKTSYIKNTIILFVCPSKILHKPCFEFLLRPL